MAAAAHENPRGRLVFDLADSDCPVETTGISGVEAQGRWTDGPRAELSITDKTRLPAGEIMLICIDVRAFTFGDKLPFQRVNVSVNGAAHGLRIVRGGDFRRFACAVSRAELAAPARLTISFDLPDHVAPKSVGVNPDTRSLGVMLKQIIIDAADERPAETDAFWQYGRPVGGEASKTFDQRIESGFWRRFMNGPKVLDIGFRGYLSGILPILEGAIGVDVDYPGYDGKRLPFEDDSQDAVFSSHCLEHISDYVSAIQEWHRVIKIGGHVITAVPSAALYERKGRPPSRWNDDHKRFYSPASLLAEFESALAPNSYRVRFLEENDRNYRYDDGPEIHPFGSYEIVLVIEKIRMPHWGLS